MNDDLRVSIFPFVELLIGGLSISKCNLVRNHEAGLGLAGNDHIPEVSVISLHIALSSAEG